MTDQCQAGDNGDCQHVHLEGRLRTIPFGTHIIGGRTVSVSGSSGDQAMSRQKGEGKQDNLAEDLDEMLNAATVTTPDINGHSQTFISKDELMINLVPYLVDRDHKILNHGINVGRKQK